MMRLRAAFFLFATLVFATHIWAADLPQSCGDINVKFDVKTKKGQPLPAAPGNGKAQIIFIENENTMVGFLQHATVRYGMNGRWVGANYGNSYFALNVDPGVHHLCANWQSALKRDEKEHVYATSFNAEAGRVYYFAAKVTVESKYITNFGFSKIDEDEAKYQIKNLPLSTWKAK